MQGAAVVILAVSAVPALFWGVIAKFGSPSENEQCVSVALGPCLSSAQGATALLIFVYPAVLSAAMLLGLLSALAVMLFSHHPHPRLAAFLCATITWGAVLWVTTPDLLSAL